MKRIFLLFIAFQFIGCTSIVTALIAPKKDIKKNLKIMKKGSKTIIFLPTIHIAKPIFFENAKIVIDSLRNNGYTVFYEEIAPDKKYNKKELDSVSKKELIVLYKKYRKMMGSLFVGNLTDPNNKSIAKFYKKKKLISQTTQLLGIDSLDINADVTLTELITAHESKHGTIKLSICDKNTAFKDKYKCKKEKDNYYAIHAYRDSIATHMVLTSNKEKSLLIYGAAHKYMMWAYFRDAGYTFVE